MHSENSLRGHRVHISAQSLVGLQDNESSGAPQVNVSEYLGGSDSEWGYRVTEEAADAKQQHKKLIHFFCRKGYVVNLSLWSRFLNLSLKSEVSQKSEIPVSWMNRTQAAFIPPSQQVSPSLLPRCSILPVARLTQLSNSNYKQNLIDINISLKIDVVQLLTLVLLLCWCDSIWERSQPFLQFLLSFSGQGSQTENIWYQSSYAIGWEIIIDLSANSLECKYWEHFRRNKMFYIIISPL